MEEILLKDICDLDNGYAFKSDDYIEKSDTLNCRMSNIRPDGTFDILYNAKYLPNEFAEKYKEYLLNDGDLIIAMTDMAGDPKILGVPTVVETKGYKLLLNQRVGRLKIIREGVNTDYLKLALQCSRVRNYLKRFAGGGVQLNVGKKDILNAPVRMRNREEQAYITDLFKRVLELKSQREKEIQLLDNLIKARFVEMFGDYHTNSKGFECHPGRELFKFSSGKFLPEERRLDEGIPVYGGNGIAWYTDEPLIDYPTVIIGRVGAWCGNIHTVLEPVWITDNAIYIKELKTDKFTLEFLTELMKVMDFHQYADFSGQPKITQKPLETSNYLTPPVEMQIEFTDFVKQVDKSKVAVQKALDEAQTLFDSLMQEYFG